MNIGLLSPPGHRAGAVLPIVNIQDQTRDRLARRLHPLFYSILF